jgi:hypothetical protein
MEQKRIILNGNITSKSSHHHKELLSMTREKLLVCLREKYIMSDGTEIPDNFILNDYVNPDIYVYEKNRIIITNPNGRVHYLFL